MSYRVNSAIHLGSAVYGLLMLLLILMFMPNALYTRVQLASLTLFGVSMALLDLKAGLEQWRRPPSSVKFSMVLHLAVAIGIVALLTFDYEMARPVRFADWFRDGNFWFLTLLGVVRAVAGAMVLHLQPK